MRTESEFISAIDCCFPYEDTALATSLIEEGCKLSPNAAFMVVHELARRPANSTTPDAVCLQLLDVFDELFTHPLKKLVLGIARRMICGDPIGTEECINAMIQIEEFKGLYNALAIPYFAGYDKNNEDKIDRVYYEIFYDWKHGSKNKNRYNLRTDAIARLCIWKSTGPCVCREDLGLPDDLLKELEGWIEECVYLFYHGKDLQGAALHDWWSEYDRVGKVLSKKLRSHLPNEIELYYYCVSSKEYEKVE